MKNTIKSPVTESIQRALDNFDNVELMMAHLDEAQMILDGTLDNTPARENTINFTVPVNSIEWGTY